MSNLLLEEALKALKLLHDEALAGEGVVHGSHYGLSITGGIQLSPWECPREADHQERRTDDDWVCEACGSSWWSDGRGTSDQPFRYRLAARARWAINQLQELSRICCPECGEPTDALVETDVGRMCQACIDTSEEEAAYAGEQAAQGDMEAADEEAGP